MFTKSDTLRIVGLAAATGLIITALLVPWMSQEIEDVDCWYDPCDVSTVTFSYGTQEIDIAYTGEDGSFEASMDYDDLGKSWTEGSPPDGDGMILAGFILLIVACVAAGIGLLLALTAPSGEAWLGPASKWAGIAAAVLLIPAVVLIPVGIAQIDNDLMKDNEQQTEEIQMDQTEAYTSEERGLMPHAGIFLAPVALVAAAFTGFVSTTRQAPTSAWNEPPRKMQCPRCTKPVLVPHGKKPHCQACGFR